MGMPQAEGGWESRATPLSTPNSTWIPGTRGSVWGPQGKDGGKRPRGRSSGPLRCVMGLFYLAASSNVLCDLEQVTQGLCTRVLIASEDNDTYPGSLIKLS